MSADHDTPEVIAKAQQAVCDALTESRGDYQEALRIVAVKLARLQVDGQSERMKKRLNTACIYCGVW